MNFEKPSFEAQPEKNPVEESFAQMKEITREMAEKSRYRRERFSDLKEQIVSSEGEKFLIEHVKDAESPDVEKIFKFTEKFNPEDILKLNNSKLADLVILCAGAPGAISQAFKSVERGGTILFFAPLNQGANGQLPVNELFWRTEITLTSSYAGSPDDYRNALNLIASGSVNLKDLITHHFGLKDTVKGFRLVQEARESIKVIIEPQE